MTASRPTRSWTSVQRILIYIAAAGLLAVALRWLWIFVLTDYRSQHRPLIIPLAIASLVLAVGLLRLWWPAIVCSVAAAAVIAAIAIYVQFAIGSVQPFLAAVVVGCVGYVGALFPRRPRSTWRRMPLIASKPGR